MNRKAFQDTYPEVFSHCYGCGSKNTSGLHIKSYWDGENTIARYTPQKHHTGGVPDKVYGGMIASLFDCHGTASAAAAAHRAEGREIGTEPHIRFITASLCVDFIKPTPMGSELEIVGKIIEIKPKKIIVNLSLSSEGYVTATGQLIAIRFSETQARPSF